MRRCRECGRILTKNLKLLKYKNVFAEEYKDGLCVECWMKIHRHEIIQLRAAAILP